MKINPARLGLFLLLASGACLDLDVANPNEADRIRAMRAPEDMAQVAATSVNEWWYASTFYEPYFMLDATADAITGNCCWVRFDNLEPRIPFSNIAYSGTGTAISPWSHNYAAIASAADAMTALDAGVAFRGSVDATERARAAALWTLAASHMNLALLFDSAYVVTRAATGPQARLQGYGAVRDSALALWDELIALTAGKPWQWDATTLPLTSGPATAATVNRLARTMAARTLVYAARTAAENRAVDWTRVLAYADGGLTGAGVADMDFAIVNDEIFWYSYIQIYGGWHDRFRVDQRLIHRMAANIPARFSGLEAQPLPVSEDARLAIAALPCAANDPLPCTAGSTADYVYTGTVVGDASRGIYMQSPFWHRRYANVSMAMPSAERRGKPMMYILAAENDLLIAEALARTGGNLARAAALVNKTHVGRGGRAPVAATVAAVLAGVEYERDVELLNTGGIALFDRRRVDGLQPGTVRHLPVPARELELLGRKVYTFGGIGRPDM